MAEAEKAAAESPVLSARHSLVSAERLGALDQVLQETRLLSIKAFLEELLRDRDREWTTVTLKASELYKQMGMLEAAKLVCPACARGMISSRNKADEKQAATWMHHPEDKEGKPDRTVGTTCLAAVILETLEANHVVAPKAK
jgi:hypothetical protein